MKSIPKQILGSFEDIGKDVVKQGGSVPKDILGKALEAIGSSSGSQSAAVVAKPSELLERPNTPIRELSGAPTEQAKKIIARRALEYLASAPTREQPLSVWERQQKEIEERNKRIHLQQKAQQEQVLQYIVPKKSRGDLYGKNAKRGAVEKGKNIRQD